MGPVVNNSSICRLLALGPAIVLLLGATSPVRANETDCKQGDVTFVTNGVETRLSLQIHERPAQVGKGLLRITELPPMGGVFAVYPEPRESRVLMNSDVLTADMMSFGQDGKAIAMMQDQSDVAVDEMTTPDGMLFAAYLAGGTIDAAGFDMTTVVTGWTCTD
jgi:hypothetical protein